MVNRRNRLLLVLGVVATAWLHDSSALLAQVAAPAPAPASAAVAGKTLTLADYPRWNRIVGATISADGAWFAYGHRPNEGDQALFIKGTTTDTVYTVPNGADPVFAESGHWVAYYVELPKKEADALRKARKPVTKKAEARDLSSGATVTEDRASALALSSDGAFLAVRKEKADREAKHEGADLILIRLATGERRNVGNVSAFAFNKGGTHLAYLIDAADKAGNGVHLLDLRVQADLVLDTATADYAQLTWNEAGTALAALRGSKAKDQVQKANVLLAYPAIGQGAPRAVVYDPAKDPQFPKDMVLSEFGNLKWSPDASRLFCGIKEQRPEPPTSDDPVANVDVWHWKDERVQSVQMVRADADRKATYLSAVLLDSRRLVRLADEAMPTVTPTENGRLGIGRLDKPYRLEPSYAGGRADYYLVDTATGARTLIARGLTRALGASPDSRWFLYLANKTLWAHDLETGKAVDVSTAARRSFVNEEDDHPYEKPIYGLAGWARDGRAVLVYHRYDVWRLPLDGSAPACLTKGQGDTGEIVFRRVVLDPEEKSVDTGQPMLLSAYGEWTKKSGFYRLHPDGRLEPLLFADTQVGRPLKARLADRVVFTRETFVEFPDYYTSTLDFASPRRLTDANPQQSEFAWGRRVLVDFKNSRGVRLQATLTLPANYQPGTRYPMIVYFYEKVSQNHHAYSMPVYDDRPHMSFYASNGYLVLQPDIVYVTGHPGDSALDCVTAATRKVIELGYADPGHIGIQGHSWGGYETSFILTQTSMFAAVVTGAPLTDLVSFYDTLYKSTGTVQQGIIERGQGRMGTGLFDNRPLYESQSPVHHAPRIQTPFLILHGTADGAVDWIQGLELYNAARRLGKKPILLSYPGEEHHLTKVENQKDFQRRMKEFFDHHLKGAPAPAWMTDGVPFLEKPQSPPKESTGGR